MAMRGIRGATTVESNTKEEIIARSKELLEVLLEKNRIKVDDIASAIFSVTEDVNAEFPAVAARHLGWLHTPLFCTREIQVPGGLQSCIRVLLHVNSDREQKEMMHVYLYQAQKLRPDLGSPNGDKYYTSLK